MEKTTTQELLAQAEKICAQRNVRLTPQRLEVLRLMSLQDGAISAYDLLDLLRPAHAYVSHVYMRSLRRGERRVCRRRGRHYAYAGGKNGVCPAA